MLDYLEADIAGKKRICQTLIDVKALIFGKIIPSINVSPFYVETRWLFSNPKTLRIITEEMAKIIKQLDVDLIAGCEFAGVPIASALSLETNLSAVYLRKKPKEYGSKSAIVGKVSGSQAILIDDASGRGIGKEQFAKYLEEAEVRVTDMLVIYWTGHPLVPWYAENNVKHHQLIEFEDFAHYAYKVGYISQTLHDMIWDWWKDYNIEKRSFDWKRWDMVFTQAKKEGFEIFNESQSYEDMVADAKRLGKWIEPPAGKYEYI
ncbi:MAG: hypothetical protein WC621_03565 [Patescibacteria group bacterium]